MFEFPSALSVSFNTEPVTHDLTVAISVLDNALVAPLVTPLTETLVTVTEYTSARSISVNSILKLEVSDAPASIVVLIVKLEAEFCSKALPDTNPLDPTKACDMRLGPQVAVLVEPNALNAEFNGASQLVASHETSAIIFSVGTALGIVGTYLLIISIK
jgi:hypothetical protein